MFIARAASLIIPQAFQGTLTSDTVELAALQRHGFVCVNVDPRDGQITAILQTSTDDETWADLAANESIVIGCAVIDYTLMPVARAGSQTLYLRVILKAPAGKRVTASAVVVPVAQSTPHVRR